MIDPASEPPHPPLLTAAEPPAVSLVNPDGAGDLILVCDHASNRVPMRLAGLGLRPEQLASHIAWDPGAAEVARRLSRRLDAPLVLSGYSRLVIDCNRPLASPQSIAEHSAGILVPGNQGLRPAERRARVEALFEPYHAAIDRLLDSRTRRPSLLLAIHSFTPRLQGRTRPWPVGISPGRDRRFGQRLARALAQQTDRVVGEDQPYAIEAGIDHTLPTHGDARGLANAMVEIRQDGICSPAEADAWARHLARAWLAIAAEFAGPAEQA